MSVLICELMGARGRKLAVYDNKCVIMTDVTLGSIIASNATDGQKTIFYLDTIGVQFKKHGLLMGFLQLETSSMQMNNQNSNFFSENAFTFEEVGDGNTNLLMEKVHDYIVDRIEGYKYGMTPSDDSLCGLVEALRASGIPASEYANDVYNKVQLERERERQRKQQEMEEARMDAEGQIAAKWRAAAAGEHHTVSVHGFLDRIEGFEKMSEVVELLESLPIASDPSWDIITREIDAAAQVERFYGPNPKRIPQLVEKLRRITD